MKPSKCNGGAMDRDTGTTIKPITSTSAPILWWQHNMKCEFLAVFCFTNIFLMWMYIDLCVWHNITVS